MLSLDDTIAAIASPAGGAGRGIVRLSGANAVRCLASVFDAERGLETIVRPTALEGSIRLDGLNAPLACLVYWWPAGRSYTGQPVAEIHLPGSPPLVEAALGAVCRAGARLAEPGEFTLRAFLAGRIDLTQAEAVLGVIDATDRRQLDVALDQLAGGVARPLSEVRRELVSLLADLEAGLDFPEEDLPFLDAATLVARLEQAGAAVERLLTQMQSRALPQPLARVVLVGAANAGKSSLFNALAGRAAALVHHEPGTTRDYLEAELDLGGLRCCLVDTAGVESVSDKAGDIDCAAQEIAAAQLQAGLLRIFCIDGTSARSDWEREQLAGDDPRRIVVLTKSDRLDAPATSPGAIATSSVTGQGLDELRRRLRDALTAGIGDDLGVVAGTAARCRQSLALASECLARARQLAAAGLTEELVASELRLALGELGRVAGEVYTDEILDLVFSRFCVGK